MTFVYDDEVEYRLPVLAYGLYGGKGHVMGGIFAPKGGGIDSQVKVRCNPVQLVHVLFYEFLLVGEYQHPCAGPPCK